MNIYQRDYEQTPEIFRLIKAGDNAAAKDHLRQHPDDVLLRGWMDATPLHSAVTADQLEMVEFLVQNGADVNASRSGTWPFPLHWAKSLAVATYLVDHGARLDAQALEYATRSGVPEVIALLLDRGAIWKSQSPPYLFCDSIAAIQVYLDYKITLDGCDDHGRNLLHHLVWSELPNEFDFAYAHGAPWKQDLCGFDPYYFGKLGGRRKMMAHIKHRYPELGTRTVRVIKAFELHFKDVSFLVPCAIGGNALIVWSRGERLGRIEIHDGRWWITKAVQVNVGQVRGFCIDSNGDIILPTADDVLLVLDAVTLQLKRTIPVAAGMDIQNICYVQSRQMYLAYGSDSGLYLLNLDFELVKFHSLSDRPSEVKLNASATLVCTVHFDQETFRVLYHLDENLALNRIMELEDNAHASSKNIKLDDHDVVVNFGSVVVAYRYGNEVLEESWQLPLSRYPCEHDLSCAVFLSSNKLIVGRGRHLLLIDAQIPEIIGVVTLDLAGEIRDLNLDVSGEYLIVRGCGLKLVRLNAIHWDGHR